MSILRRVVIADQFSGMVITVHNLSAAAATGVGVLELCDIVRVAGYHEISAHAVARSHDGEGGSATRDKGERCTQPHEPKALALTAPRPRGHALHRESCVLASSDSVKPGELYRGTCDGLVTIRSRGALRSNPSVGVRAR